MVIQIFFHYLPEPIGNSRQWKTTPDHPWKQSNSSNKKVFWLWKMDCSLKTFAPKKERKKVEEQNNLSWFFGTTTDRQLLLHAWMISYDWMSLSPPGNLAHTALSARAASDRKCCKNRTYFFITFLWSKVHWHTFEAISVSIKTLAICDCWSSSSSSS